MDDQINTHAEYLDCILAHHQSNPHDLLQMLREAQEHYGYVHSDAIDYLSGQLKLPRSKIEGVASFYSLLYLQAQGEYRVLFSDNITDRMLGNMDLMESLCGQLWVEPGKVSEDGLLSIGTTSCTGMCDQGPAILVNNIAINRLTPERVGQLSELIRERVPLSSWPLEFFAIEDNIRRRDILLGSKFESGKALAAMLKRGATETLQEVKLSRLRGRGGAGFSTGSKWEYCREAPGEQHYVVCNADEGEPGTFKDRVLLQSDADMVFEGMTGCARDIGAQKGFL